MDSDGVLDNGKWKAYHEKNKCINLAQLKSEVALMDIIGEKLFKEISDVYKRAIY